jgi:SAM-dependent methyltransferase
MHFSARELIKKLEFPFCYLAYIVDSGGEVDYFHYGLWNKKTDNVKQAQENLAHLMKSLIPDRAKSILDVGCGLGRTVYDLSKAGYHVVGISPDKGLIDMAKKKYAGLDLRLIECAFENFEVDSFARQGSVIKLKVCLSVYEIIYQISSFSRAIH